MGTRKPAPPVTRLRIGPASMGSFGGWADVKRGSPAAIYQETDQLTQGAGAVIRARTDGNHWVESRQRGLAQRRGPKVHRKRQHFVSMVAYRPGRGAMPGTGATEASGRAGTGTDRGMTSSHAIGILDGTGREPKPDPRVTTTALPKPPSPNQGRRKAGESVNA